MKEVAALRRGDLIRVSERLTVEELVERFLDLHEVDPATTRTLQARLKHATREFGDRRPDELSRIDLEVWRRSLAPGVRHYAFRSFRQALTWAVARNLAERNPSEGIRRLTSTVRRASSDVGTRRASSRTVARRTGLCER